VVVIGVDPHKRTHTATAVQPGSNRVLATVAGALDWGQVAVCQFTTRRI
jgi:hypothetical protein